MCLGAYPAFHFLDFIPICVINVINIYKQQIFIYSRFSQILMIMVSKSAFLTI